MSDANELRREADELRREVAELRQQLADAKHALGAMARGEVDAVAAAESAPPVLLEAAQRELRNNRALLRAVFDGSLDALLLADNDGIYVDANPAACELFGLPREELVGSTAVQFAPPGFEAAARFEAFRKAGRLRGQFPLRRADGTTRILDFSAVADVVPGLHLSSLRDVTERVAAEEAFRRSEARFRAMIEKGEDGITLLTRDVKPLYQSPAVERILGYSLEEAKELSWQEWVDEAEQPKLARTLEKLLAAPGTSASVEFRIRKRDGTRCWLELTATNRLDDPDIGAIVSNYRDVTHRKLLEEQREAFFRLTLDLLAIGSIEGYFQRLNPAWTDTLGWSLEELCARPWLDFVHPEDQAATARDGARLAEGQVVLRFENRFCCKDGTYRWLKWASIRASDGLVYASAHDVTTERAAAQRDRLLFQENPVPMFLTEPQSLRFLAVNDAAAERYGYTADELMVMTLDNLVVDGSRESIERELETVIQTGTLTIERRHRTKSGQVIDVYVRRRSMDLGGLPVVLGVVLDVSESKRLERERAHHLERLRLLELSVSRLNDIVLITKASPLSNDGPEIVYVNRAFERITGYSTAEATGKTPRILQGADTDPEALARIRQALERAEPIREQIVNYTKAGVPYWVEVDIAPVRDDAGELTHFVAVERDTTEQHLTQETLRRSDERLRQAQKMEAIGNLAGGIAHDFNNLLTVILSFTELIMSELSSSDPLRSDLNDIHDAGLRATALTRQLLAFSRKQILQPQVVDVSSIVLGVQRMLDRVLGEHVELAIHTAADAGRAFVDPSQLEQVILNLVVNARDAMPNGGTITIETASVVLDEEYAASHAGATPGSYVLVAVSDTGTGMDRATQERIFEPFFTTKERGKGTGLGLSTVYGIVQQSRGHLWVYSELDHGTTFKIYLPRTDRVETPTRTLPPTSVVLRGTETILLVEDEAAVRHVVRSILQKGGYHVLEASNGGEAFLLCEQFKATIHLLITDVVMPRMSGRQLAERLSTLRPEMKVLFMSGYTEDTIVHHGVLDAGVEFLPKPILREALLRKVRQVLDVGATRTATPFSTPSTR